MYQLGRTGGFLRDVFMVEARAGAVGWVGGKWYRWKGREVDLSLKQGAGGQHISDQLQQSHNTRRPYSVSRLRGHT